MGRRPLTKYDPEIRRRHQAGEYVSDIANALGLAVATVRKRMAALGLASLVKPRANEAAKARALGLLQERRDLHAPQIAVMVGVSAATVRRLAETNEALRRPVGKPTGTRSDLAQDMADRAIQLWFSGHRVDEIATLLGRSTDSVYRYLRAAGVDTRRG